MINTLFPLTDYTKLKYDNEGLYSITKSHEADKISKIIIKYIDDNKYLNLHIFDGTGGLGGNTINFSKYFVNVTSFESNSERCDMLKNNITVYGLNNVKIHNCDSVIFLDTNYANYNVFFFDPPWGGPSYKEKKNISLTLGNRYLLEIANFLKNNTNNKLLIFKLPYNYNFKEFNNFNYKLHKIKNYYILVILI
jgi:16S rRNA G966 N2-methylase RsmD